VHTFDYFWRRLGCVVQQWSYNIGKSTEGLDHFFSMGIAL